MSRNFSPVVGQPVEASALPVSNTGTLLTTQAASARVGYWFHQNNSATAQWCVLDDGAGGAQSIYAVASGASIGSEQTGPHLGRIRIYGTASASHSLRVQ